MCASVDLLNFASVPFALKPMWADHETDTDLLGFEHLVQAVVQLVSDPALLPATIGVYGDWGSGKSSLLKMTAAELAERDGTLVLHFNGWLFEGYDDAKAALMETILTEIVANRRAVPKAKALALRLLRRVNWLRLAKGAAKWGVALAAGEPALATPGALTELPGLAADAAESLEGVDTEELEGLLQEETRNSLRQSVAEFRTDFERLLSETDIDTLVVVIDDLDRCLPDTVIETLEAIKLFLFVPKTAFVIGADQRLVQYAVKNRFPELPGIRTDVGRDYLEKLIQFSVRIPALGRAEIQCYMVLLFMQAAQVDDTAIERAREWVLNPEHVASGRALGLSQVRDFSPDLDEGVEESLRLAERIAPILAAGLSGNPRQCKRFLNTLLMRLSMAQSRGVQLEQRVLAKLMLLEYFRPESFRKVAALAGAQGGCCRELGFLESAIAEESDQSEEMAEGQPAAEVEGKLDEWLAEPWLHDWLALEPPLGQIDLRPYFYFSRDVLGPLAEPGRRLSPAAQEVLAQLLHDSDAVRESALQRASELSAADAAAVFEELGARVRMAEDIQSDPSALQRSMDWVGVRKELTGQMVLLLDDLPEQVLPPSVVPRTVEVCQDTDSMGAAKKLLQKWSESQANNVLAKAAEMRLSKLGRE